MNDSCTVVPPVPPNNKRTCQIVAAKSPLYRAAALRDKALAFRGCSYPLLSSMRCLELLKKNVTSQNGRRNIADNRLIHQYIDLKCGKIIWITNTENVQKVYVKIFVSLVPSSLETVEKSLRNCRRRSIRRRRQKCATLPVPSAYARRSKQCLHPSIGHSVSFPTAAPTKPLRRYGSENVHERTKKVGGLPGRETCQAYNPAHGQESNTIFGK